MTFMRSLNAGYKLLTLIIASLLLSFTYNIRLNLVVTALGFVLTLTTTGVNKKKFFLAMIPFFIAAAGTFMTGLLHGRGNEADAITVLTMTDQRILNANNFTNGLKLASRILAYGGLGMMFAFTTDSMELIMSLMQQFRLPPKFAYGILAAYHFFPVVQSEYGTVGAALKVRGVKAGPFSTKRLFPMLVHALERSENLAMAMESRGFEAGKPRACAFRVPLRARDFVFLFGLNGAVLAGLFLL
ncbi:MAG: energy-coupling factor transporter transmembrane component T [Clostridia bacterium]|nr:energy-coupling factor transporter transmembrane component T [Clostridia bacterium]